METPSRLLLVDGHAVAYRAFYAIRELSTRDGLPTNALYGFIRMMDQLCRQWAPTHRGVVFDGGLPEERLQLLPQYKAQREEMPDELERQFPLMEEYLACARIPVIRQAHQEADDLLATLARVATAQGADVLMATSDKDMFQIVSSTVGIIPPTKSDVRMGPDEVRAKTGVEPDRIADWLALIGDAADNIPGVPGVGPKTAAKLLNAYGSLIALYDRLSEIKQDKLREALVTHREAVFRNVKMTKLRDDLAVDLDWPEWRIGREDVGRLRSFYQRMQFNTLARELENPTLL